MHLSDFYPAFIILACVVAPIIVLTIFFSLWSPIHRRVNPAKQVTLQPFEIDEIKGKAIDVYFQSGAKLESAIVLGCCDSPRPTSPFEIRYLLKVELPASAIAYVRLSEIEYFVLRVPNA